MPRQAPRSTQAKHNPVVINKTLETAEQSIPQGESRLMSSTGDAKDALQRGQIITEPELDAEKFAMLDFMKELVSIRIATSTDKNAEQVFEINVNGKPLLFRRGEEYTVPRYYVDRMLRLKQTAYTQQEVTSKEGVRDYLHIPQTALKYDFAITRDANPLGLSWYQAVLREPG